MCSISKPKLLVISKAKMSQNNETEPRRGRVVVRDNIPSDIKLKIVTHPPIVRLTTKTKHICTVFSINVLK